MEMSMKNHSRESGHHMRGSLLLHSLCDVLLMVLYIVPCSLLGKGFKA